MVRSVWLRSDGRGEVSQVAVSSVEDWLVTAVEARYGEVRSGQSGCGQSRHGGRGSFRFGRVGCGQAVMGWRGKLF